MHGLTAKAPAINQIAHDDEIRLCLRTGAFASDRVPSEAEKVGRRTLQTAACVARGSYLTTGTVESREFASEGTEVHRQ